jgi:hypothetical protein
VLETLESIAYQLFPRYRFPLDEVLDVLQQGKDCEHVDQLLERDGILIKGTVPGSDLHFLHQTFHEYLVARALANKVRKEGWKNVARLIKRKAWHIEWRPVIVLLAGQLPDPSLLLELLADEKRDELFCHRLSLAAECLLELSPTFRQSHSHVIDAITTTALFQWMKFHAGLTVQELDNHDDYELDLCVDLVPQVNHALAAVGAARGRVDSQLLKRRVPHWMSGYSMLWRRLRKWLPEIEQEGKGMEVTQVLLACLHRSHIPWWLRFLRRIAEDTPDGQRIFDAWWRRPAIRALGIVGTAMARNSPDIAAALLKFLLSSEYYFVDRALGDAFRTMGGSLSTRDLIEAVFLHPDAERIVGRLLFGRWRRSRLSQGASLYTDLLDALGAVAARGEAGGGGDSLFSCLRHEERNMRRAALTTLVAMAMETEGTAKAVGRALRSSV